LIGRRDGRLTRDASRRSAGRHSQENAATGESVVGSAGRAGRLIGGASHRSAGRQRRRDAIAGKLEADPHAMQDGGLDAQAEGQLER